MPYFYLYDKRTGTKVGEVRGVRAPDEKHLPDGISIIASETPLDFRGKRMDVTDTQKKRLINALPKPIEDEPTSPPTPEPTQPPEEPTKPPVRIKPRG